MHSKRKVCFLLKSYVCSKIPGKHPYFYSSTFQNSLSSASSSVSHMYTVTAINNSIFKVWLLRALRVPDDLGTNYRNSISYSLSSL